MPAAAAALRLGGVGAILTVSAYVVVLGRSGVPLVTLLTVLGAAVLALDSAEKQAPRRLGLWAIYAIGFALFADVRALADQRAFAVQAAYPLHLDRLLFRGVTPSAWLQGHLQHGRVDALELAATGVYLSYFVLPHVGAYLLWKLDQERFAQYVPAVLFSAFTAVGVSVLLPTAPPWLAGRFTDAPPITRTIAKVLGGNLGDMTSVPGGNALAAMPSVHMALTVLLVLACWKYRRARPLLLAYAVAMAFSLVYLGEHYVVDELAGTAVAGTAWIVSRRVRARRELAAVLARLS